MQVSRRRHGDLTQTQATVTRRNATMGQDLESLTTKSLGNLRREDRVLKNAAAQNDASESGLTSEIRTNLCHDFDER
jgi:hypothetical protein